jgi:predicted nuclease with TOPRIM domain
VIQEAAGTGYAHGYGGAGAAAGARPGAGGGEVGELEALRERVQRLEEELRGAEEVKAKAGEEAEQLRARLEGVEGERDRMEKELSEATTARGLAEARAAEVLQQMVNVTAERGALAEEVVGFRVKGETDARELEEVKEYNTYNKNK